VLLGHSADIGSPLIGAAAVRAAIGTAGAEALLSGGAQQVSPRHASRPSLTATAAMTRAAIGSAQLHPKTPLRPRPTSSTADRYVQSKVCLEACRVTEVTIGMAGTSGFPFRPGRSVLDAADAVGLDLPQSCGERRVRHVPGAGAVWRPRDRHPGNVLRR